MKLTLSTFIIAILLTFTFLPSCTEEDTPIVNTEPEDSTCRLSKMTILDTTNDFFFITYTYVYNAKEQCVGEQYSDYNGSSNIKLFNYDSLGRINAEKRPDGEATRIYEYEGEMVIVTSPIDTAYKTLHFEGIDTSTLVSNYAPTERRIYYWDNGNISKIIVQKESNGTFKSTTEITYDYDDKPNYNGNLPTNLGMNPKHSKNNIIKSYFDGVASTLNSEYTYNEDGYPIQLNFGNEQIELEYVCE